MPSSVERYAVFGGVRQRFVTQCQVSESEEVVELGDPVGPTNFGLAGIIQERRRHRNLQLLSHIILVANVINLRKD